MSAAAIEIFGQYARQLHRYLLRRWRRPQDIDDLAQEVFLKLLQNKDTRAVEKPLAYLYGVASHVLADHMFAMKHTRIDWNEDADDWLESPSQVLPDDMSERLNLQQQIDAALADLTPRQREVILLHKRDGWSFDEIAALLGISWETVSRHVVNAKARIRTRMWER